MRVFDLNKSINENLKFEIQLAKRTAEHSIYTFSRLPIFEKINQRFHLFNENLETKREEIIKTYIDDLTYCFERKFVREDTALNCINFCKYQLHSCLNTCCIDGGVLRTMQILSAADIPDFQDITYYCDDFEVALLTHDFLFDLLKENVIDTNNDDEANLFKVFIDYYDHITRAYFFEALSIMDDKGILDTITTQTPIVFNFGEANTAMYSVYYYENKNRYVS